MASFPGRDSLIVVFLLFALAKDFDWKFALVLTVFLLSRLWSSNSLDASSPRPLNQSLCTDVRVQTETSPPSTSSGETNKSPVKLVDLLPGSTSQPNYGTSRRELATRLEPLDREEIRRVVMVLHNYAFFLRPFSQQIVGQAPKAPATPAAAVDSYTVTRPVGPIREVSLQDLSCLKIERLRNEGS